MPPIAEAIAQVFVNNNSIQGFSAKQIADKINSQHPVIPPVTANSIYHAVYREWRKGNYTFYIKDYKTPFIYYIDIQYYTLVNRFHKFGP